MAETLQHGQTAKRLWIQTAGAEKHRPDGPENVYALTMKMDHFVGLISGCEITTFVSGHTLYISYGHIHGQGFVRSKVEMMSFFSQRCLYF